MMARAEYAYVAESSQPDAHGAVVEQARYLAALAPEADIAVCRAIDATGDVAGLGVSLADKAIDRDNLPSQTEIACYRARERMQNVADQLERRLADASFSGRVLHCEGGANSFRWPSDEFLVLVELPTIYDWHRNLEALVNICKPPLQDRIGFLIAPIRDGRIVASLGVK
jgi:hypothetical protein